MGCQRLNQGQLIYESTRLVRHKFSPMHCLQHTLARRRQRKTSGTCRGRQTGGAIRKCRLGW